DESAETAEESISEAEGSETSEPEAAAENEGAAGAETPEDGSEGGGVDASEASGDEGASDEEPNTEAKGTEDAKKGKVVNAGALKGAKKGKGAKADASKGAKKDEPANDDAKTNASKDAKSSWKDRRGGFALAGLSLTGLFLLMSHAQRLPHGSFLGLALTLGAVLGILRAVGFIEPRTGGKTWRDTALGPVEGEAPWMSLHIWLPIGLTILFGGGAALGLSKLPYVIIVALAALIPPAIRRPGVAVFLITALIYAPLAGTFGLWDPWETHYGEVAREMISRDDWISLWWAHENWFWSKPILIFWSEAFWLSGLDIAVLPGMNPPHPEWAIRLPVLLFSLTAVMVVYNTMKRVFGARAGMFAALTLATAPHFFMLAHQAITDMYLVSNVTMALSFLAVAVTTDEDEQAGDVNVFGMGIGLRQIVLGVIALATIPQAMYLITRNVTFYPSEGFSVHRDTFLFGSGNNDGYDANTNTGTPGMVRHAIQDPAIGDWWAQPVSQGIIWLLVLGAVFFMLRKETKRQALYMMAFYFFCALAFMGKTIPGVAIPGMVSLFFLVGTGRWRLLFSGALKVAPGILGVLMVAMPWFVAMFMRHSTGFTDRLLVHDNINRVAAGVHGDTGSIEYFIEQLGAGLFPWVGLVPAAVLAWVWMRSPRSGDAPAFPHGLQHLSEDLRGRRQAEVLLLFGLWFFSAFTLFSAMITKFHHYIFPAVPPGAILVGLLLERFAGTREGTRVQQAGITLLCALAPIGLVLGFASLWGDLRGVIPDEVEGAARADWVLGQGLGTATSYVLIFVGAAGLAFAARWLWQRGERSDTPLARQRDLSTAVAVGAGTVILAFVARDVSWVTSERPHGYERFIHLFVYNYSRPWPEYLDFRPILTGFGITATALIGLMALRWTRAMAARAAIGTALLFSAWSLNLYLPDLAPHWGMENLFERYFEEREGPHEPVLAFQMNWKGENFYTGNSVYTFVDIDTTKLRDWIEQNRGKTIFVLTETGRLGSFRSLVPGKEIETITDERFNNKFLLVRVRDI
ncbi:MAG: glycosyltransferase family 39 protein, partial [Myxococcota bacterium]